MTAPAVKASADEETRPAKPPTADQMAARVADELGDAWIPRIYRERVHKMRTRSHKVEPAARGARVEVQHTLLGIELQVGRKRQQCPDLSTARYLAVFARIGCNEVAVPYDITRISKLADDLESAWQRAMLLAEHLTEGRGPAFTRRVRSALVAHIRAEVEEAGAGAAVPEFNQNTRQRRKPVQDA